MHSPHDELESLDAFEAGTREYDEIDNFEAGAQDGVFGETEEMELAAQLLEITGENELDGFLGALITRAAGGARRLPPLPHLRRILGRTAQRALPAMWGMDAVAPALGGATGGRIAAAAGDFLGREVEGGGAADQELEVARRFVRFAGTCAGNVPHFLASAPSSVAARRAVGVALLQELYEAPSLSSEEMLVPLLLAEDEELDYFLGKVFRKVGRAVGGAAKAVGKAAGGAVKTVGKGLSAIDKVIPINLLTSGLSWTPMGMMVRAGLGATQAVGEGKNPFQGALRSLARDPVTRFAVDTGAAVAGGENLLKAAQKAYKAGVGDLKKSLQLATMVAPFIPGIGTGVAAALGAATALANGEKITDALVAAARSAIPGGAVAQMAFDTAVNLAKGKNIGAALLDSARSRLPGGPAAQAAFDAAVTLAKGKSIQAAALAATGRLLPKSPFAAPALDFVKKVTSGQPIQNAALSSLGNHVLKRIERQSGPLFSKVRGGIQQAPSRLAAQARGRTQAARAAALALVRRRAGRPFREIESMDEFEIEMPDAGEVESFETGAEDSVFGETEEMELASQLLEITDERELDGFIGAIIARATGGMPGQPAAPHLRGMLRQAAKSALTMIGGSAGNLIAPGVGGAIGSKLAVAAGDLFGLELEGMSPEDQEFEVARRFVRFAGAGARNAARFRGGASPSLSARRALGAAARRHAPGFLRRKPRPPRPPRSPGRPGGGRIASSLTDLPDSEPLAPPIPIAVTCHCCGAPQPAPADLAADTTASPGADTAASADANPLPDNEPANSTEPQTVTSKETAMHDIDRTTMEISDEAGDFESPEEQEYGYQGESPFSQDEVEELAANLLEISDEQELDQFLGDLFKKAKRLVGGALKSPLLRPLGGFLKGAIKKALPIAGGALGNLVAPGIGGQVGSRLASGAGDLLGLEYENVAPEDQEFEVAKGLVQMAGTAIQNAAQAPAAAVDPQAAAKSAVIAAAKAHVPGLLQQQAGAGTAPGRRPRSGRWYRRGGRIVLVGI